MFDYKMFHYYFISVFYQFADIFSVFSLLILYVCLLMNWQENEFRHYYQGMMKINIEIEIESRTTVVSKSY